MNDKEKQIEEMTKDIQNAVNGCAKYWAELIAKYMFTQGYRKLPEDSVVLSRGELNDIENKCFDNGLDVGAEIGRANARKETAEKICLRLIEIFSTAKGVCSGCALQHDKNKNPTAREFQFGKYKGFEIAEHEVKELAKQFSVEIKE